MLSFYQFLKENFTVVLSVTNTDDTWWNGADPPAGEDEWKAPEDGFAYAVDLIRFIRRTYGDYFVIAVGGQFFTL